MPSPEPDDLVYVRCARVRAKNMGNRSTEERIEEVAKRPAFRASHRQAYMEGWMDALIHEEDRRNARRKS